MGTEAIREELEFRQPAVVRRHQSNARPAKDGDAARGHERAVAELELENQRLREIVERQAREIRWLRYVAKID